MTTKGSVFGKRMPGAGHLDRTTKSVVPVEKELLVLGQQRRWGWDVDTTLWSLLVPSSDCSLAAPVGLFHSPLPWHADLHLFVVTEQDLYSLKDALVALCIPTSWLSHPGLTVPFHILSCRSQAISWHAVVELLLRSHVISSTFWFMFWPDPVRLPKCCTSHTSKDWFCHSLRAVSTLLL